MILYSRWCALSLPVRNKLAETFGIQKKGATEVHSNVLKHDGYLLEDIEKALSVEAMQKFLGASNTDMTDLWNMTIAKIEGKEVEGLTQAAPEAKPAPGISVLSADEAKQFKKEYKQRKASKPKVSKPKTIKTSIKKVARKTKKNA